MNDCRPILISAAREYLVFSQGGEPHHLTGVKTALGLLPSREQARFYSNLLRGPPHRSSPTASKNCDFSRAQVWSRYTRWPRCVVSVTSLGCEKAYSIW